MSDPKKTPRQFFLPKPGEKFEVRILGDGVPTLHEHKIPPGKVRPEPCLYPCPWCPPPLPRLS